MIHETAELFASSKAAAFWTALILGLGVVLDALPEENRVILTITALALLPLAGEDAPWRDAARGNPCKGV